MRVGKVEDRRGIEDLMVFCPLSVNQIIASNLSNPEAPTISYRAVTKVGPLCNQLFKLLVRLIAGSGEIKWIGKDFLLCTFCLWSTW